MRERLWSAASFVKCLELLEVKEPLHARFTTVYSVNRTHKLSWLSCEKRRTCTP